MTTSSALNQYRLLGRSGLRVSPLSLGTMTFGSDWGWGADDAEAQRIFDRWGFVSGNRVEVSRTDRLHLPLAPISMTLFRVHVLY